MRVHIFTTKRSFLRMLAAGSIVVLVVTFEFKKSAIEKCDIPPRIEKVKMDTGALRVAQKYATEHKLIDVAFPSESFGNMVLKKHQVGHHECSFAGTKEIFRYEGNISLSASRAVRLIAVPKNSPPIFIYLQEIKNEWSVVSAGTGP